MHSSFIHHRAKVYIATGLGLTIFYALLRGTTWQGGPTLHTAMESMATLLALIVGALSLVRYYSRKNSIFLLVGVGFLGTGFLDGYHALVTSAYFKPLMPSDLPALIPWSWVASRQFLAIMMVFSWLVWWREENTGEAGKISDRFVYVFSSLFTLASFLFFAFFPLPPAYYPDLVFHRPEELVPALFFLIALVGYLKKGLWRTDAFEHWMVLSLIVGFVSQAVFMSFSGSLFDLEFDAAHTLKKVSYICVMTGLLYSMYAIFHHEESLVSELDFQKSALDEHAIVSITDDKGNITYVNDRFCDISGYAREELLGKNHRILKSGKHSHEFYDDLWKTISNGKPWHGDIKNNNKNGGFFWVRASIVPFLNKQGKPFQYIAIRTDITKHKRNEADLIASREEAIDAARTKADFLANMSHEIRTPMNGVIGMLELLQGTKLSNEQSHYVDTAIRSADMQINVINDILDFSKIESNKLDLEYLDFHMFDVLEDIATLMGASAQAKGVVLTCFCDPDIPGTVKGDPTRLRQILANLVGNAVKFTDAGEVNIEARLLSDNDGKVRVRIEVRDTGIGIDDNQKEYLFQSFTQADTSTTRKFGGTGLGLSISNSLVGLMGSRIEVKGEKGVGSIFWFDLTLDVGQATVKRAFDDLGGLRVVIVDDNLTNREILESYLNAWGIIPIVFDNSQMVLDYFRSTTHPVDLAIFDYHMPDMDGLELAQTLASDVAIEMVPLIMLSSSQPADAKVVRDAGINVCLSKPIGRSKLLNAIMTVLGHRSVPAEVPGLPVSEKLSGKVLLVEDTFINQQVAIGILAKLGLHPDVANNGRKGVEMAVETDYDLILMDVQMPEMDGFEATAFLREREEREKLPRTPIIAMTAHALEGDRERCLDVGMDDYVAKPVRRETMELVLRKWMTTTLSGYHEQGRKTHEMDNPVSDEDLESILDADALKVLRNSLEALPGAYRDILFNFLESAERLLNDIRAAIEANDPKRMEHAAHSLKSNSATLGAMDLSKMAAEVETIGRSGIIGDGPGLMERMEKEFIRVKPAVTRFLST